MVELRSLLVLALSLSLTVLVPERALAGTPPDADAPREDVPREDMPNMATSSEQPAAVMPAFASIDPPPPPGRVMLGLGITGVVFGALNVAFGTFVLTSDPDGVGIFGLAPLTFGVAFVTVGALGIHYGKRRRAALRRWEQEAGVDLEGWRAKHAGEGPPPGLELVVGGSVMTACGASLLAFSAVVYSGFRSFRDPPVWTGFGMFFGTLATISGSLMMGVGSTRVHRHRRARGLTSRMVPVPVFLGQRTYGFGVAGRF
jgi:hypothetical protein